MLNANQMMRVTPKQVRAYSRDVQVLRARKTVDRNGYTVIVAKVRTVIHGQPPRPIRTVTIRSAEKGEPVRGKPDKPSVAQLGRANVRVHCTCEFFNWFGCADVLYNRGAGFRKHATGIMPDQRNPQYVPFVCKHLYRVFRLIQKEGK
jgi:hypothetical protein